MIDYLARYEARYGFPIERPKAVLAVEPAGAQLRLRFADGGPPGQAVVSATGTWGAPVVPGYPGSEDSAAPKSIPPTTGAVKLSGDARPRGRRRQLRRQILAELSLVADAAWVTLGESGFSCGLTTSTDACSSSGRAPAYGATSAKLRRRRSATSSWSRPSGKRAIAAFCTRSGPFARINAGRRRLERRGARRSVDAVIWCTGFRPAGRGPTSRRSASSGPDGRVEVRRPALGRESRVSGSPVTATQPAAASATLIGAGRGPRPRPAHSGGPGQQARFGSPRHAALSVGRKSGIASDPSREDDAQGRCFAMSALGRMTLQRRKFLAATAMAAVFRAPARAEDAGLSFGLTPVFLSNDLELLALLRAYLTEAIGEPIELVQRRTYQEITGLLLAGQPSTPPGSVATPTLQYESALELIGVPVWHGQPLYRPT